MELGYVKFGFPVEFKDTLTFIAPTTSVHVTKFKVKITSVETGFGDAMPTLQVIYDKQNRLKDISYEEALKLENVKVFYVPFTNVAWFEEIGGYQPEVREVAPANNRVVRKGKGKGAYKPKSATA